MHKYIYGRGGTNPRTEPILVRFPTFRVTSKRSMNRDAINCTRSHYYTRLSCAIHIAARQLPLQLARLSVASNGLHFLIIVVARRRPFLGDDYSRRGTAPLRRCLLGKVEPPPYHPEARTSSRFTISPRTLIACDRPRSRFSQREFHHSASTRDVTTRLRHIAQRDHHFATVLVTQKFAGITYRSIVVLSLRSSNNASSRAPSSRAALKDQELSLSLSLEWKVEDEKAEKAHFAATGSSIPRDVE